MNTFQLIKDCQQRMQALRESIPVKPNQFRIAEIDELMSQTNIWNDNRKAASLLKERRVIESLLSSLTNLLDESELLSDYAESFPDEVEQLTSQAVDLDKAISSFELSQLLKGPHDNGAAILTISAGAGGSEAKNFCLMLCRMYLRYADIMGWKSDILDEKYSEEHSDLCLDNVSIQITGDYAYGYLKSENGVMRLIRNSPFNSNGARHTSFAAVNVVADIEDKIEIEIDENDVDIQAIRSGGPGGQNSNKVSSCIRLVHRPSGISIKAQTERSQLENKRIAFKLLKAKLYEAEIKKKEAEQNKVLDGQSDIAFGHQLRTYTLSPFQLVKNHKSGFETNQVDKVLNGEMQDIIVDNLRTNSHHSI